jgi:hypothetical protein
MSGTFYEEKKRKGKESREEKTVTVADLANSPVNMGFC